MKHAAFMLSLAATCVSACADSTSVNPVPTPSTDAAPPDATTAPDAPSEASAPEAGPRRREVMNRSPFGRLDVTDNLLIDGDMELSGGAGQTPWVAIGAEGQTSLLVETGGRCRSGLRCLVLNDRVDALLGSGVAAGEQSLEFSMWAKVPAMDCGVITVYLFKLMTKYITGFHQVHPASDVPDADGWCRYHALRGKMDESVGVYIEAELTAFQRVLVDDAVLRPADGSSPETRSAPIRRSEYERIVSRLAPLHRNRWIGPPPRDLPR